MCAAVVSQVIEPRTLLTAVKRILTANGVPEPTTVEGATGLTEKAVQAVNDAQDEIYARTKWDWRFKWMPITLIDRIMWYLLPDDYGELATDIPFKGATAQLENKTYQELCDLYPDLRHYPPGSGVSLSLITEAAGSDLHLGTPKYFVIFGGYFGLIPRPDADFVEEQIQLVGGYYRDAQNLYGNSDAVDMPKPMWRIHHNLANAYFKQYMEYDDWRATEARAERQLRIAVSRHNKKARNVNKMRVT